MIDPERLPDFSGRAQLGAALAQVNKTIQREQADKRAQEMKEQERDAMTERGVVAAEKQVDYAKRSHPYIIYTAIIATVAMLLSIVQFVLWLLKS